MCKRPSPAFPESKGTAIIEAKENLPDQLIIPILWKPCACEQGFVVRSPGNDVWVKAIRQRTRS